MATDHSDSLSHQSSRLAVFLSTGEFSIFALTHPAPSASSRLLRFVPRVQNLRNTPIVRAAYHHPLLVTLSATFRLTIYDLRGDKPRIIETLSSFTSYLPSSFSLSYYPPSSSSTSFNTGIYKLILAYSVAVYPAHWSVGVTELLISASSFSVTSTRTARACEIPFGFIDAETERGMREQWGRRVKQAADVATDQDGRWIVLGPGADAGTAPNALQLYRLHLPSGSGSGTGAQPRLNFVRHLHGLTGPVARLAITAGRCVCIGENGCMRVWDLESGSGAEVRGPDVVGDDDRMDKRTSVGLVSLVFDERKVLSVGREGVQVRRFDI
jgi:hypothetical protein